ncbi:hypothetical protein QJS10_CPB11g00906 [Acorus calamus]|uniref:Uncharacterized protein n=1 Tax=Acorus calamus TaxID=4465 RepID=A0AAV9DVI2_ACOCL|nr:hypothetical protein QJS10_CPB11g00906 [Acorus calamus]
MAETLLTPTQRYAAGALFALALRQSQIHQTRPLGSSPPDGDGSDGGDQSNRSSNSSGGDDSGGDDASLFLEIESKAWPGLEETAALSPANHHVGAFLRMIFEECNETSSERMDHALALAKSVDAMEMSLESTSAEPTQEKICKYEQDCFERNPVSNARVASAAEALSSESSEVTKQDKPYEVEGVLDRSTDKHLKDKKHSTRRKGYDARHRVALRLLATWLDVKWSKLEAMELMVACSALAAVKAEEQSGESGSSRSKWSSWKRGGIIGAAALTGGTLLAITGGLAAPAIAAGFSALAPTLGTLVPVIGASGFAAAASAAGSVAGSVAVAASFGVGILVSGFVFEVEDFVRPWNGWNDGLERFALQWESKNLISVSTAIQDWLTSRLTMELMKQGAMMTVLSTLLSALAWPATLLAATDFIDSKWAIAVDRPVTLVGFSLGARVIFKCLQHLAGTGNNEGLIERVVLLGAPIPLKDEQWEAARKNENFKISERK